MTLLLAGGTGLVGRSLLELAKGRQIPITTVGRRITGDVENELVVDLPQCPPCPRRISQSAPLARLWQTRVLNPRSKR